jgi:hypothetical protein
MVLPTHPLGVSILPSGKSTFINHIIRREVQTTGVAPTDDSFTVIVPGKEDVDQNGPSVR